MERHGISESLTRRAAFFCMGGMVIISAAQLAMAIYLLVNGMKEALLIVTESFMIYSVGQALVVEEVQPADRMNAQVMHQPRLSRLTSTILKTMSSTRTREPTGLQQNQNHVLDPFGPYHCDVDDCLGALPNHCHPGFCESRPVTAQRAR